ncbi:CDGSH iron-sulfur domain-containing protein 3, mitochondrial-like isoform X2 [Ostrinia furnacalis]|uniref:CDGSH iron-sulfur domain-containing protein 3, mitochondrial-like isoform X2 n=1 Tax=Ostrinia furnacalis TaxID=93504 RepID=UPI001038C52E|nr:CDGSH iron-sulfur domain-containing protein 3, mitochondrial-like isoform X2 [Ostrinia furnacalis]
MFIKKLARALRRNLVNYGTKPDIPNEVVSKTKPYKVMLEMGKKYSWCACGHAKTALCDGTHKDQSLNIKERPIKFSVDMSKDYFLCTCRKTKNIPFCDGSHKTINVKNQ